MEQPKKDTVLWWLNRIADEDLRHRAVSQCTDHANSNELVYSLGQAIPFMDNWDNTLEGAEFWADKSIEARDGFIELLPEPQNN